MIERAVDILRAGGLVAFPTETVYGLGADARNADAVAKIFAAKGRPPSNPLIVHIASVELAKHYANNWPASADLLAAAFWPGPLTLVVNKSAGLVDAVAAGGATVGLRVPNHPLALELLTAFAGPLAAPSANRSNRISPTTADHVRQELGARVAFILDGGPCTIGIESTVLDLTTTPPAILRPGGVSQAEIESIIGPVVVLVKNLDERMIATSPGQQATHYAPATPAIWILANQSVALPGRTVQIVIRPVLFAAVTTIYMSPKPTDYAAGFYRALREADALGADQILVELPPDQPAWIAVRDRILRACRPFTSGGGAK